MNLDQKGVMGTLCHLCPHSYEKKGWPSIDVANTLLSDTCCYAPDLLRFHKKQAAYNFYVKLKTKQTETPNHTAVKF